MIKKNLKTIEYVSVNDGMYEGLYLNGKLLGGWHENDASWRSEYFDGIFEELGYRINYSHMRGYAKCPNYEALQADLKAGFGDDGTDDEEYED